MKKYYQKTSTRSKIGLAQEDYISFLKVSKSALGMYETNKRSLPTWALVKQGAIEICLHKPGTKELELAVAPQEQETAQLLKEKHNECRLFVMRAERQLDKMKKTYERCINMLHVAKLLPDLLPALLPENKREPQDLEWIEIYGKTALYKLKTCNIAKQQLLQVKIDALKYECSKVEALM